MIEGSEFADEFREFDKCNATKKLALSLNFDLSLKNTEVIRVDTPAGVHFMQNANHFKKYYEQSFNASKWINDRQHGYVLR